MRFPYACDSCLHSWTKCGPAWLTPDISNSPMWSPGVQTDGLASCCWEQSGVPASVRNTGSYRKTISCLESVFQVLPSEMTSGQFEPPKVVLPLTLPGAIWMAKGQMVKYSHEKACLKCFLSSDFLGAFNLRTLLWIPKIRECDGVCSISRHYFPLELSLIKNPTGLAPRRARSGKLFSLWLPHHHPAIIPTLVWNGMKW